MQPNPPNNNTEMINPPIRLIKFSHLIFPRAGRRTRFNRPFPQDSTDTNKPVLGCQLETLPLS